MKSMKSITLTKHKNQCLTQHSTVYYINMNLESTHEIDNPILISKQHLMPDWFKCFSTDLLYEQGDDGIGKWKQ